MPLLPFSSCFLFPCRCCSQFVEPFCNVPGERLSWFLPRVLFCAITWSFEEKLRGWWVRQPLWLLSSLLHACSCRHFCHRHLDWAINGRLWFMGGFLHICNGLFRRCRLTNLGFAFAFGSIVSQPLLTSFSFTWWLISLCIVRLLLRFFCWASQLSFLEA